MNSSGLKTQQLHPCTVCISDGIRWPVSCFAHNLMRWTPQLVHVGGVLSDLLERDLKEKRSGADALRRELLPCPHHSS